MNTQEHKVERTEENTFQVKLGNTVKSTHTNKQQALNTCKALNKHAKLMNIENKLNKALGL